MNQVKSLEEMILPEININYKTPVSMRSSIDSQHI